MATMTNPTKTKLDYQREADSARLSLEAFKSKIAEIVPKYAKDYDLCDDGVRQFMNELGLPYTRKISSGITVTINYLDLDSVSTDYGDEINSDSVQSEITDAIMNLLSGEHPHMTVEIEEVFSNEY